MINLRSCFRRQFCSVSSIIESIQPKKPADIIPESVINEIQPMTRNLLSKLHHSAAVSDRLNEKLIEVSSKDNPDSRLIRDIQMKLSSEAKRAAVFEEANGYL